MSLEFIIIYSVTVFIASITPGPSMILALNHGIKYGAKRTLATAFGNLAATLIQAFLSIIGLGAILLQSEAVFSILKYLGAIYLIYIGIKTFFVSTDFELKVSESGSTSSNSKKLFLEAFFVTAGNPKAIIFFTALFPQFIDARNNTVFQFAIILVILAIIAFSCMMVYSIFGQNMVRFFSKAKFTKIFKRLVGGTFIGMGIGLATGKLSK